VNSSLKESSEGQPLNQSLADKREARESLRSYEPGIAKSGFGREIKVEESSALPQVPERRGIYICLLKDKTRLVNSESLNPKMRRAVLITKGKSKKAVSVCRFQKNRLGRN
jgi:hypothetical protein